MTKLKRDAAAWVKRLKMGRFNTWAIVEGAKHDTPFYEGILTDGAGLENVQIIRAGDLTIDNQAAGGKIHAIKLFNFFQSEDGLSQENSRGKINVFIFLDKDDDDFHEKIINAPHLIYSNGADVEAEIITNSVLPLAIANAFSISRAEATTLTPMAPAQALAEIWAEWISLRLAASAYGINDVRFSPKSLINEPLYTEQINHSEWEKHSGLSEDDLWLEILENSRNYVKTCIRQNAAEKITKGKWLPGFIIHEVKTKSHPERQLPKITNDQLVTACLGSIDFKKVWANYYQEQIEPILDI